MNDPEINADTKFRIVTKGECEGLPARFVRQACPGCVNFRNVHNPIVFVLDVEGKGEIGFTRNEFIIEE